MEIIPKITQDILKEELKKASKREAGIDRILELIQEMSTPRNPTSSYKYIDIDDPNRYKDPYKFFLALRKIR